jgi:N-acetylneuraminic acid mutarotase/glucose/arabinose dehydrogenase
MRLKACNEGSAEAISDYRRGLLFFSTTIRRGRRSVARRRLSAGLLVLVSASLLATGLSPAVGAAAYDVLLSTSSDRSSPVSLDGLTVSGNIYVFTSPDTGVKNVKFWLDNPQMTGAATKSENGAPYDFAGTANNGSALPYDTSKLPDGPHSITARVELSAGGAEVVTATFNVNNSVTNPYDIKLSTSPDRSGAVSLDGQTVTQNIYVFTSPTDGVSRVKFWLDNPQMSGTPTKNEGGAPYDFAGTASNGNANPYDTTKLLDGAHSITTRIELSSGSTQVVTASFIVNNSNVPALVFNPTDLLFDADLSPDPQTVQLTTSDGSAPSFTSSDNADWLTLSPASGSAPASIQVAVDSSGLAAGTYNATAQASSPGYVGAKLTVQLKVGGGCSPLACEQILVDLPYELEFSIDHGKIVDANGVGTGFTYVDKPTKSQGYIPSKLAVDEVSGMLNVETTKGLAVNAVNSQDNTLGVGIDGPSQVSLLSTTLVNPPAGTGNSEQAGLWFGNNEDNYVKLVVISTSTGTKVQYALEINGSQSKSKYTQAFDLTSSRVALQLRVDPAARTIAGKYSIDGGSFTQIANWTTPDEFFSFDAAGIDPRIGTRSFGGVFASHRNGPAPLTYKFDAFSVVDENSAPPPTPADGIVFDRISYPNINNPTSMVWGPDNRLYVLELFGKIHALSFDANRNLIGDQVITTLGSRLSLGLTVDPASSPSNVILWASHSSPSLKDGVPNSGMITKLSGSDFTQREDVITGIPRAIANHGTNSIHFGPDGKLYIAQGGNTGAGAPNEANTEFGTMQEQPLSAALLVADVKAADFDGSCHNAQDIFGPPPCDVTPYATGMRNMYDFVIHSNGSIYGPDNGLGVTGSFPPSPTPPCTGMASTTSWQEGGHNPGRQPDILFKIEPGKYYGHPNPHRDECVFKDGSYQGVAPLPTYKPPIFTMGQNTSSNGTIEYLSGEFCGDLQGDLLITNYSVGDNIVRLKLSENGNSVISADTLAGGFNDPLPITEAPDGTLFVGEFGANKVTALLPVDTGCWETRAPLSAPVLDAGGATVGGKLYVVGGKNGSTHLSSMHIYDPATNSWTSGPAMPGPAVENPAMVAYNGKVYVFGGSTAPFSGAVSDVRIFDPSSATWTTSTPMPTARGGATAQVIGTKIYVVGGMDADGASLATLEIFDPASGTWTSGASLDTRRDNPGSAVSGGKLYVFGGRIRNADGGVVDNTLTSVEMYEPTSNAWVSNAPMPTGRRTMVVGTLNGKFQLIGGERKSDGSAFSANEEYDPATDSWRPLKPLPTPRHGAVVATINGVVYVVGGATDAAAGTATNVNEAFSFGN